MQIYNLPYPPSINSLYRHRGPVVYKTEKWKEWVAAASVQLINQSSYLNKTIDYPIAVEMAVGRPDKRVRDLDNLTKVVFDFLQSDDLHKIGCRKIIENDHLIHHYEVYWSTKVVGIKVIIKSLKPIETGALTDC